VLNADSFWDAESSVFVRQMPTQIEESFALRQLGYPPAPIEKDLRKLYQDISEEARRWLGL
jgi:hypothetical protein